MSRRRASINLKAVKSRAALTITHPNAAGIDIGSAAHFVAVPPDRDDTPVREFPGFTVDLNAVADWLTACRGGFGMAESGLISSLRAGKVDHRRDGDRHERSAGTHARASAAGGGRNAGVEIQVRQQNLWASCGSGSLPST